jgi:glycosyltransferase involved in cell wall biosynthesis
VKLFLFPVPPASLYNQLLLCDIGADYEKIYYDQARIRDALLCVKGGEPAIAHFHWEEHMLRRTASAQKNDEIAANLEEKLPLIVAHGGKLVWTVHNEAPHRSAHMDAYRRIRRALAQHAHRILVHNRVAIDLLRDQVGLSPDDPRIVLLPHPSYAGLYEPQEVAEAEVRKWEAPEIPYVLGFGELRAQKGYGPMIETLDPVFTTEHGARLRFAGRGEEGEALRDRFADRADIDWDLGFVPMEDVPAMVRGAACVVLPYERVLTSGVAMLVLTLGGIVVAPTVPTFTQLLPPSLHSFLYVQGDAADMRRATSAALALSATDSRAARLEGIRHVAPLHPRLISQRLRGISDDLAEESRNHMVAA